MADRAYSVQENSVKPREFDPAELLQHSASAGTFTLRRNLYLRKSPAWGGAGAEAAGAGAGLGCTTVATRA